ncbi:MAG TPA: NAD(P)/FAD-dependent oxidoreductase [Bacilli bacterium]|nr:NAD(P)/FAD-dependent oxidoreductase [Bacilli bacterium]
MDVDVIVIGGGPAGLMASVSAAEHGAKVLLVDKGNKLGRKLAISGGGRCNVTNRKPINELIENIPGNGRFMHSPFSVFNNEDIIAFFESLGIKLKEEDRGRMFPVSDKATTVVNTLLKKIKQLGVTVRTNTAVDKIIYTDEGVKAVQLRDKTVILTKAVVVATGGMSVPHTGSTGDGYPWAIEAGHTITELYPTEVPITSNEPFIKDKTLQGLSLRNVALSVINPKGKTLIAHDGDMIFTHFGISGPIALRCSQFVVKGLKKLNTKEILLAIDLFPEQSQEEIFQQLRSLIVDNEKKSLKNVYKGLIPERLLQLLFTQLDIDEQKLAGQLSNEETRKLAEKMKRFTFYANGTLPLEKAFVTGGGIATKEIKPKTMESRFKNGLYFAGEILDIHGYTGGYNITVAFSTGYAAGKSAAEHCKHLYEL